MKDSLKDHGISKEEIKAAIEFAELKPDTNAAHKLLEFLDTEKVKEALVE
jgi:hypothetical protein